MLCCAAQQNRQQLRCQLSRCLSSHPARAWRCCQRVCPPTMAAGPPSPLANLNPMLCLLRSAEPAAQTWRPQRRRHCCGGRLQRAMLQRCAFLMPPLTPTSSPWAAGTVAPVCSIAVALFTAAADPAAAGAHPADLWLWFGSMPAVHDRHRHLSACMLRQPGATLHAAHTFKRRQGGEASSNFRDLGRLPACNWPQHAAALLAPRAASVVTTVASPACLPACPACPVLLCRRFTPLPILATESWSMALQPLWPSCRWGLVAAWVG